MHKAVLSFLMLLSSVHSPQSAGAQIIRPVPDPGCSAGSGFEPNGERGQNWNAIAFEVREAFPVRVTVENVTRSTASGNWSSIDFWVNCQRMKPRATTGVDPQGEEHSVYSTSASASYQFILNEPGRYRIEMECGNGRADAWQCSVEKVEL